MSIYNQPIKLDFNDVMILPKLGHVTSRAQVDLNSRYFKENLGIETCGVIAANMDGVGTIEVAKVLKEEGCMTALHKHYPEDELIQHFSSLAGSHSFYSMGMTQNDLEKLDRVMSAIGNPPHRMKICIDVANGYMREFGQFCGDVKRKFPNAYVMAGNVVNTDGIENLSYADVIKLGIGQGSNCLTRTQTGIGYPQFSCIYDALENWNVSANIMVCSDGGCVNPGDVSKAFAVGASMVMIGGLLAGTDEGGGDIIEVNGRKTVEFYGMSSVTAQKKHNGGLKDYRSSEGRTTLVPYKGNMRDVIRNILGGIRSTCSYVGVNRLDLLPLHADFIRVNTVLNRSMEQFTIGN